jgi:hypothetical protein
MIVSDQELHRPSLKHALAGSALSTVTLHQLAIEHLASDNAEDAIRCTHPNRGGASLTGTHHLASAMLACQARPGRSAKGYSMSLTTTKPKFSEDLLRCHGLESVRKELAGHHFLQSS